MARSGVVDVAEEGAAAGGRVEPAGAPPEWSWNRVSEAAVAALRSRRALTIGGVAVAAFVLGFVAADVSVVDVVVDGIETGAIFSLIGLGIALVYKATRVLNFAQGELGTTPAFVAYVLMVGSGWQDIRSEPDQGDLWWASIVAILLGVLLAVLINALVVQRLHGASPVIALVATVGVALLFTSAQVIVFEAQNRVFPRYVAGNAFTIGDTPVEWHTLVVLGVLAVAATLLALFFRTPPGIALLATSQEPFAAELSGVSVRAMSTLAWALAGALGAVGGLLGAGVFESIRPGLVTTTFLIPAFAGAVLGGLTSMVGAVAGGLILGIVISYANELWLATGLIDTIPGPPQVATLTVLLVVLIVRPRGLFGAEA